MTAKSIGSTLLKIHYLGIGETLFHIQTFEQIWLGFHIEWIYCKIDYMLHYSLRNSTAYLLCIIAYYLYPCFFFKPPPTRII